MKVKPFG